MKLLIKFWLNRDGSTKDFPFFWVTNYLEEQVNGLQYYGTSEYSWFSGLLVIEAHIFSHI